MVARSRQFGICGIAVVIGILWTLGLSTLRAEDWPNWRGPDHNGISRETGWDANKLKNGPIFLWRKQIGTGFGLGRKPSPPHSEHHIGSFFRIG